MALPVFAEVPSLPEESFFDEELDEEVPFFLVPCILMLPMPDAMDSNCTCFPSCTTETLEVSPACTESDSSTVYVFCHGPVTVSATSLFPSHSTSSQVTAPSATETETLVSLLDADVELLELDDAFAPELLDEDELEDDVDSFFEELPCAFEDEAEDELAEAADTGTVFDELVPWRTHDPTDSTMMSEMASTATNAIIRLA